jgi:hypothetical protein
LSPAAFYSQVLSIDAVYDAIRWASLLNFKKIIWLKLLLSVFSNDDEGHD